jgi:hypothetical protein
MKIDDNGIIRNMTAKEESDYKSLQTELPPPEPTPEERIQALEAQNEALTDKLRAALILLGLEE